MNFFIAGADLACSAVAFVLLFGLYSSHHKQERKYVYLTVSVLSLAIFSAVDGAAFLMDELGGNDTLHVVLNVLSFVGVDMAFPAFAYYVWEMIGEGKKLSMLPVRIVLIGSILDTFGILYGSFTGELFSVVNGESIYGWMYNYTGVSQVILNLYFAAQVYRNREAVDMKVIRLVSFYLMAPMVAAVLEFFFTGFALAYVVVAILFLVIYIVIVSEEIQKSTLGETLLYQASVTDNLTGLPNRRAYEEDIQALNTNTYTENFVYLSMDVNELKIANDNLGHAAGDELLIGAASCMRRCFGAYGKIYRTGGDEFTAILYVSENQLSWIRDDFENVLTEWKGSLVDKVSVSYGYVTGKEAAGKNIHDVSILADKRMYESKSNYYRQKGVDRRGRKEAHVALCELYTKILKINITDDTFQMVNVETSEQTVEKGFSNTISGWLSGFGKTGQVHPDDLEDYLAKTNLDYMREYFKRDKTSLTFFYRRKFPEGYKRSMIEIIPASDYQKDNQSLFLYVKRIDK